MVVVRRLRQRGEIGRLFDCEILKRLVEIIQRGRRDAVGADAEIDFVQIKLEDSVFRESPVDPMGEDRFFDLPLIRYFVRQQEVLGDLLRDRRRPDQAPTCTVIPDIGVHGARDAEEVDAFMVIEVLVFRGEKRLLHFQRNGVDRHVKPPFGGVFRQQIAGRGVQPGRRRGFVIRKRTVVGQIAAEIVEGPEHADDGGQPADDA